MKKMLFTAAFALIGFMASAQFMVTAWMLTLEMTSLIAERSLNRLYLNYRCWLHVQRLFYSW